MDCKLILGDCLEKLKDIPDESIDCIITDPPYGINYESNHHKKGTKYDARTASVGWDKKEYFFPFKECWRVLKNDCDLYVFGSFKNLPLLPEPKQILVWDKVIGGMGDLEANYAVDFELIFYFKKGRRILNKRPPSSILVCEKTVSFSTGNPNELFHPTQKPVGVIEELILNSTRGGEFVLDPFMGSGTTGVAALKLGRRFIGIEIDEGYFKIAEKRIGEWQNQQRLDGEFQ